MKRRLQTIYLLSSIAVLLMIFLAPFTSAKMANMTMYGYIVECINEKYYETSLFWGCLVLLGLVTLNIFSALLSLLGDAKLKNYGGFVLSVLSVVAYLYASPFNKYAEIGAYLIMLGLIAMCTSSFNFGSDKSKDETESENDNK